MLYLVYYFAYFLRFRADAIEVLRPVTVGMSGMSFLTVSYKKARFEKAPWETRCRIGPESWISFAKFLNFAEKEMFLLFIFSSACGEMTRPWLVIYCLMFRLYRYLGFIFMTPLKA